MKEKAEAVEITIPVKIRYSTPEGRERAIKWAHELAHIGGWSSECGGISVKRVKGKRTGEGR